MMRGAMVRGLRLGAYRDLLANRGLSGLVFSCDISGAVKCALYCGACAGGEDPRRIMSVKPLAPRRLSDSTLCDEMDDNVSGLSARL